MHIPFRNSALTKILKTSLTGNTTTLIILCASPALINFENTIKSMYFGQCANRIEN